MKALLLTNLFPSIHEPSRGLFNLRRFQAASRFCAVRVVAPVPLWRRLERPHEWFRTPASHYEGLDVSYPTNWALPRVLPQHHARQMYVSLRSHVRSVRRQFPFDVILGAFAYPDAVVSARLARDFNCPFVALVMGSDMNDLAQRSELQDQIARALSEAHCVIALSTPLKERVVKLGVPENRVLVQRNGVDGARFTIQDRDRARRKLGIDRERSLACFIGNLVHEKGPDVLIGALARFKSARTPVHAAFVGDGPLRADLQARAERLGVGANLTFAGPCVPADVADWLAASDMLCLPSRREGCPNVVLEALACGRPVVASAVGGVPELLSDNNGVLVPPGDPKALADAIASAFRRSWDPFELRASVPSLSWESFGKAVYTALWQAVRGPRLMDFGHADRPLHVSLQVSNR